VVKFLDELTDDLRGLGPGGAAFCTIFFAVMALMFAGFFAVLMFWTWPGGAIIAGILVFAWWELYRWYRKED